jgi:hypothetical protein
VPNESDKNRRQNWIIVDNEENKKIIFFETFGIKNAFK